MSFVFEMQMMGFRMFFSPQKECATRGETRGDRIKKLLSFDSPGSLRELRNASLMCFCHVMVANASHSDTEG